MLLSLILATAINLGYQCTQGQGMRMGLSLTATEEYAVHKLAYILSLLFLYFIFHLFPKWLKLIYCPRTLSHYVRLIGQGWAEPAK